MAKSFTQAAIVKSCMDTTMQEVMALLNISKQEYCDYKYECGCLYLERIISLEYQGRFESRQRADIAHYIGSAAYWGWWKLQWYMREDEFVCRIRDKRLHVVRYLYKIIHDPINVAKYLPLMGSPLPATHNNEQVPSLIKD